jgi:hypothetical protein
MPIEITARSLPGTQFQSAEELQRAWTDASVITLRGEVAGSANF